MTKKQITNKYGDKFTVKVGSIVHWKDGIEDCGEVLEIHSYWLLVKNDDGEIVSVFSEDCWK